MSIISCRNSAQSFFVLRSVTLIYLLPVNDSHATKILQVPFRSYSLSSHLGFPFSIGIGSRVSGHAPVYSPHPYKSAENVAHKGTYRLPGCLPYGRQTLHLLREEY